jgi:Mg-chelatase subunit ChlD
MLFSLYTAQQFHILFLLFIALFYGPSNINAASTCASNKIDIAMCLDNSGSMGTGYSDVQKFAKDVVSKFTISDTDTRVAVLKFSTSAVDTTFGFSGDNQVITDTLNLPLTGGTTNTHRCIDMAKALFASSGRSDVAQLMLIITDGAPNDQVQTETAAEQARTAGIVVVGVGVSIGYYGRENILKLTSNQCPKTNNPCSTGLTDPPGCTSPCDDHYMDAQTMADLDLIVDNVVDISCVDPGCQYNWGSWSACTGDPATRTRSPVITFDPQYSSGTPGACPSPQSEACSTAKCKAKADFLLLLDGSGSMGSCDWASQAWFAKEFTERLPYVGSGSTSTFELAQVGVVQFSSSPQLDHQLTTKRKDIIDLLECGSSGFLGPCGTAGGTCDSWDSCAGDQCCASYSSICAYTQKSGGTNTATAMMEAIKVLMTGRADARKVLILATDGQPTGHEGLPQPIVQWCQQNALTLYSREDHVLCLSRYAQSSTAPSAAPENCGPYDYGYCSPQLEPIMAKVVTVGINVGATNTLLNNHFTEVASEPSLYIPITDVNGGKLDDAINSLISKSCPPVDCVCKKDVEFGYCHMDVENFRVKPCIPEIFPDNGGAPCVAEREPCGDCIWTWGPWGACDATTGKKSRSVQVLKAQINGGTECPNDTQEDICPVDCSFTWPSFGQCDVNTGKQSRSPIITVTMKNGGQACPNPEERSCPVDCLSSWESWTPCNENTGTQSRQATIIRPPLNGGVACPLPETRNCDVDCEYTWNSWTSCNTNTGKQSRQVTITRNPLNGGAVCPPPEYRTCAVDCSYAWDPWSSCDPSTGKQNRIATVTINALNGGVACPSPETRDCDVDCTYNWNAYSSCNQTTGKQSRSITITTPCKAAGNCPNGYLFGGAVCPPPEDRSCPIDCVSTFTPWEPCNKNTGKQGRNVIIQTPCKEADNCPLGFLNGGQSCPPPEIRDCSVDCEYNWQPWVTFPGGQSGQDCVPGDTERRRTIQITVSPKNGGKLCPPDESTPCDATPCQFTWNAWGTCDPATGKQERDALIQRQPINGGTACPPKQVRSCNVDCTFHWNQWSVCHKIQGKQTRDLTITTACYPTNCQDGFLLSGSPCPSSEERPCDIDCEFTWPSWGTCSKTTGKQQRSPTITVQPVNSGVVCPGPEERNCDIGKYLF